jgi:hypothetical protein
LPEQHRVQLSVADEHARALDGRRDRHDDAADAALQRADALGAQPRDGLRARRGVAGRFALTCDRARVRFGELADLRLLLHQEQPEAGRHLDLRRPLREVERLLVSACGPRRGGSVDERAARR